MVLWIFLQSFFIPKQIIWSTSGSVNNNTAVFVTFIILFLPFLAIEILVIILRRAFTIYVPTQLYVVCVIQV